jgi:hypothetical protein
MGNADQGPLSWTTARALPTAAVCASCLWLAVDEGGYYVNTWSAVTCALVALVAILLLVAWNLRAGMSWAAGCALAALVLLTAWSLLSALWANAPGNAWQGGLLTALYLLAFTIPLIWPAAPGTAECILFAIVSATACLGAVGVAAAVSGSEESMVYARLAWPTGYPNATAAVFAVAAWIALVLAVRGTLHPLFRSVGFALGIWLGGLIVLTQSRGAVFTAPVAAAAFVLLSPRRLPALALLLLGGALLAPAVPSLSRVVSADASTQGTSLARAIGLLAFLSILSVPASLAAGRLLERRHVRSPSRAARSAIAVACIVGLLALGVSVSPSARVAAAWDDFTTQSNASGDSRFSGFGSNRADFWRVGLDAFVRNPIGGVGVDNFQATYIERRASDEEPRAPHSLVIRALAETGLVGLILLVVFAGGIAWALAGAARADGRGAVVSHAAAVALVGWLCHSSLDWLFEMPATGALAFAVAGIGVGATLGENRAKDRFTALRLGSALAVLMVGLAAGALWLADRYETRGASRWIARPAASDADLARAARLDPLGSRALLLRGAIEARRQRWTEMREAFNEASRRDTSDWYAYLQLAVAQAHLGERAAALANARRAAELNPQEAVVTAVRHAIERGLAVDPGTIDGRLEGPGVSSG